MSAQPSTDLIARTRASVMALEMLPAGSIVLVMVSGGGDSVALLRMLADGALADDVEVRALHLNHMLRGEDSEADERFVIELCDSLGVALRVERADVAKQAKDEGLNIEDAGRRMRYAAADAELDRGCAELDVPPAMGRIAVAHTRDDRVETFLMRLAQGAGAMGLTSLRPIRGRIVRPLIASSRSAVREYLETIEQPWREDRSNEDTDRLRARVRHDLLPVFRDINPRFDEALERSLGILEDEDGLLAEMAEAFAIDFVRIAEDEVGFDRAMMATLSLPMRRRTIRAALIQAFPDASRLEFGHVEILAHGIDDERFAHDLPGDLRAFGEYDRMVVASTETADEVLEPGSLAIPGSLDLGPTGRLTAEEVVAEDVRGTLLSVVVDADAIESHFAIGPPRQGERMRPLGMDGTRKLSDMLVDAKVPRRERQAVPVIRDGDTVVWLAGVRLSEEYKVTPQTVRAVRMTWEPIDRSDTTDVEG